MISLLWFWISPSTTSKTCCVPHGFSTDKRDRTRRNSIRRKTKTSNSMASEFEIGVSGYLGVRESPCNRVVTGPANKWLRILVNQSCSGIKKLSAPGFCNNGRRLTFRGLKPHRPHKLLRRLWRQRAKISPQEAHSGSRVKQSI